VPHAILPPTEFRGLAGRLATGVSVVVALVEGEPVATTAGSVVMASWDPPLLAVFFRTGSRMAVALDRCGRFTVNILGETDPGLAHRFALPDREQGWAALSDVLVARPFPSPPILPAAIALAECVVTQSLPTGDHRCYIGEVLDLERRGETAPLLYYRGRLRGVGNAVAPPHWSAVDVGDLAADW
jgi:flavin reductase (DIM6/NTAB) family NADH-FMN oxidoreductase RutF